MSQTPNSEYSNIVILGAGGVGSYIGAQLSQNTSVTLVSRGAYVDMVNNQGLKVSGKVNKRVKAVSVLEAIPQETLLIITTKAYDLREVIKKTRHLYRSDTTVLLLQNGLGNEEIAKEITGSHVEIVRGLTSVGVEHLAPGKIEVKFTGETILPDTVTGRRIARLFTRSGLVTRLTANMRYEVWRKLVMNCVINPLTAILGIPNNLIASDTLKNIRDGIVDECVEVARMEGVKLNLDIKEDITGAAAKYTNISSMYQDLLKGKKTEIDFLNGKICELGRKHDFATPVNDTVSAMIRFLEEKQ